MPKHTGAKRTSVVTGIVIVIVLLAVASGLAYITTMPDVEYSTPGAIHEKPINDLSSRLRKHVARLATHSIGRNLMHTDTLTPARNYIAETFEQAGFSVDQQEYEAYGEIFTNLEVEFIGRSKPREVLIIGAHYDSVPGSPGANDNASGVAALLELANIVSRQELSRTVRFVAFCNEEQPYFQTRAMGSNVYASNFPRDELDMVGMISLETIGYYSEEPGSQKYPPLLNFFYPNKGNFLAFVGNLGSRSLVIDSLTIFRGNSRVPSEGLAAPAFIPGVSWSDQWSFWKQGHRAVMVTDTAFHRYPHYHTNSDTPEKLDYTVLAEVVNGLSHVVIGLANN